MRHDDRPDKPGAPNFRIRTLTAFVAIDPEDNSEGIVGMFNPGLGMSEPLIGADDARIMQQRPYAEEVAKKTGVEVKLLRFSHREDVEVISP